MHEGAQQVVGGGQGETRLARQLFGRGTVLMFGDGLQQAHRALDGADEGRPGGLRLLGERRVGWALERGRGRAWPGGG
ncbi:hypothetical protein JCM4814A_12680 [Streptomyces phaeofaciens JCM 4814]|uniref:Uncharacterized protein n=1 Tax=Streptomyces phaeofaciens TaxID=68254 RepID=A0A918HFN1_9ACTN|nr:hypothetical protein GCM10010226_43200 [Streptomyces phaeofaciens]